MDEFEVYESEIDTTSKIRFKCQSCNAERILILQMPKEMEPEVNRHVLRFNKSRTKSGEERQTWAIEFERFVRLCHSAGIILEESITYKVLPEEKHPIEDRPYDPDRGICGFVSW